MKQGKILLTLSMSLLLTSLTGCSGEKNIKYVSVLGENEDGEIKPAEKEIGLYFKDNNEIPYISIQDGFDYLSAFKAARFNDKENKEHYYRVSKDGENYVVTEEHNKKVTFDVPKQTITYDDMDTFCDLLGSSESVPLATLTLSGKEKSIKTISKTFTPGNAVTIDLNNYSVLDLVKYNDKLYIPLATFNDCFINTYGVSNLAYNYQSLYVVPNGGLVDPLFGQLSTLGESFFNGPKRNKLSKELLDYNYQETCLNFDYFYGLKKEKGYTNFDTFINQKGFKNDFYSEDIKKVDDALSLTLSHLVDGHSGASINSTFYPFGEISHDKSRENADRKAWAEGSDSFQKSRSEKAKTDPTAALGNYGDETGKTYYIGFDSFAPLNEALLYDKSEYEDKRTINTQTAMQFQAAYQELTSAANAGKYKNVVVDLSTNDGGSSDAMIYALSVLVGNVQTSSINPLTGAKASVTYKADINLDGKVDSNDISLADKGFNIVFLDSKYTFSCGNAMPFIAKTSNSKVMTIGEKSGGGACAVRNVNTAIASTYMASSLTTIATKQGETYVSVETGIAADHTIDEASMFDRLFISTMVNSWIGE